MVNLKLPPYATTDRLDRVRIIHLEPHKVFNGIQVGCHKTLGRYRLWHTPPTQGEICLTCVAALYPREEITFRQEASKPGQVWVIGQDEYLFDGFKWRGPFTLAPENLPPEEKIGFKLCPSQVREIRALYARGTYSQRALAARFEVSCPTICNIVNYKYWSNI